MSEQSCRGCDQILGRLDALDSRFTTFQETVQSGLNDIREKFAYLNGKASLVLGSNGDGGQFEEVQKTISRHDRVIYRLLGIIAASSGVGGVLISVLVALLWAWKH